MKYNLLLSLLFFNFSDVVSQPLYYPPTSVNATWETIDPVSLGWCQNEIDDLYDFLEQENTKGFIVLKNGKIVLEWYFGSFDSQSLWYWASAGKTITSFLVGKAQEENFLTLNDMTSTYLGQGWTSCSLVQENNITIRNQLTMTTGLEDDVADTDCTLNSCLTYLSDAGTRWAYHNAPYTLLENVIQNATSSTINAYTQSKLKNPTGMTGSWQTVDFNNVYFSTVRSMARFGLLIQGNGIWNGNQLINSNYFNEMVNTSQNLNKSYGYLWWLNGKPSYMLPTTQFVFQGSYAPDAPSDMIAGIGKNGQIVSISPSSGLIVVRMGDAPTSGSASVSTVFCNQIWQKINALDCTFGTNKPDFSTMTISPNPATETVSIETVSLENFSIEVYDAIGKFLIKSSNQKSIALSGLATGIYVLHIKDSNGNPILVKKIVKK
jgi:CubicO group peptidase (beta-lactamase class C family)